MLGLEGAAAFAGDTLGPQFVRAPLNFIEREAWQGKSAGERVAGRLTEAAKQAIRRAGRARYERANGISASEMQAEVHHSDPLEYAHLKPKADPNRLANLWALRTEAHQMASREWAAFGKALEGRIPSQAEIMAQKLRIERLVEPYLRRAGVPRSNSPPGKGGLF